MKYNYILYTIAALLFMWACSNDVVTYNDGYDDQKTPYGAPVIDSIVNTRNINKAITEIGFNDTITIYGSNLAGIESLMLNDVEVNYPNYYALNSQITLVVPPKAALVINNEVTVKNKFGTAVFPIVVHIPDILIKGFVNEFARDGETAILLGNFFETYDVTKEDGIFKLAGQQIEVQKATMDSIVFTVPEGTPYNTTLSISSPKLSIPLDINFRHEGLMILNYENLAANSVTNTTYLGYVTDGSKAGDPKPLIGKYSRLAASLKANDWKPIIVGKFEITTADQDIIDNPKDYELRFEVNTAQDKPQTKGNIYAGRSYLSGLSYKWTLSVTSKTQINTQGLWETRTFDLVNMFRKSAAGEVELTVGKYNNFSFIFQQAGTPGDVDLSVCNFRIVKKQKF